MLLQINKFLKTSGTEKRLFLEAYLMLGIMRAAILTVSFKRLTRSLEHHHQAPKVLLSPKEMQTAHSVGRGIRRAAKRTPWESACLVQSLTAQRMLQKRNIPGVFYLGVEKDKTGKETMKAHAWSQCGDDIITGESGHETYTILSMFTWEKK